ncbi:MAG TPA: hypothetical protein VK827_02710 [Lysobacter sp.]|nr:hypothetical protein [Lysobacter sp.]
MTNQSEFRGTHRDSTTGSHAVGTAVGGVAGGAAAGAIAGTMFGPIGTLIGAGVGVVAGAVIGRGVAERVDPTGENEYWRHAYQTRPYAKHEYDFDRDYSVAYGYGLDAREKYGATSFDQIEPDLRKEWDNARGQSRLSWDEARPAVLDAFSRADRTHKTYQQSDRHFQSRFGECTYADKHESFDDYRPAYRYGVLSRTRYGKREWDEELERELHRDWEHNRGNSTLSWERARLGVREAFTSPLIVDYNSPYDDKSDYNESGPANQGLFRVG